MSSDLSLLIKTGKLNDIRCPGELIKSYNKTERRNNCERLDAYKLHLRGNLHLSDPIKAGPRAELKESITQCFPACFSIVNVPSIRPFSRPFVKNECSFAHIHKAKEGTQRSGQADYAEPKASKLSFELTLGDNSHKILFQLRPFFCHLSSFYVGFIREIWRLNVTRLRLRHIS